MFIELISHWKRVWKCASSLSAQERRPHVESWLCGRLWTRTGWTCRVTWRKWFWRHRDSNMIPTLVQQLVQYDSSFPKKSKENRSIYFFKISFLSGVEIRNPRCHEMRMPGGDCTSDIFLWVTFCRRPDFKSEILRFCPVAWRSSRICSAKADMREGLHSFEKLSLRSIQVHFPTKSMTLQ